MESGRGDLQCPRGCSWERRHFREPALTVDRVPVGGFLQYEAVIRDHTGVLPPVFLFTFNGRPSRAPPLATLAESGGRGALLGSITLIVDRACVRRGSAPDGGRAATGGWYTAPVLHR